MYYTYSDNIENERDLVSLYTRTLPIEDRVCNILSGLLGIVIFIGSLILLYITCI